MRGLLLDTCTIIWWFEGKELGEQTIELIKETRSVYISAASVWEISIKKLAGKLTFDFDIARNIENEGFMELPISAAHADVVGSLPLHHKDPFDRLLVAQAQSEGLTLITADKIIFEYGINCHNSHE